MNTAKDHNSSRTLLAPLALLAMSLGAVVFLSTCQQPNNQVFTDDGEIVNLMENNLDAREIFDAQVFPADTVLVDSSSAASRRLYFTEQRRSPVSVTVRSRPLNIENFGLTFVAEAFVGDKFFGDYLQKLDGQPDLFKLWDGTLDRKALLFKLGDDDVLYLGWELVGYNTGKPLSLIASDVKIRVFPASGGPPRIISDKPVENLPQSLRGFTLFIHVDALRAGERVEIETIRRKLSIFARTAQGFRQLESEAIAGGKYKYSFIVPPADVKRFFNLMTFQSGPEIIIDSLWNFFLDTSKVDTLDPPDITISTTLVIDSFAIDTFLIFDTSFDFSTVPPTVIRIDTSEGFRVFEDTIVFDIDTTIDSFIITTRPDSSFLDTNHIFDFGDIWTFPYSVR